MEKTRPKLGSGLFHQLGILPHAGSPALLPGLAEPLQLGHQRQANKGSRETTVVQAEATVKQRHTGHQAEVEHTGQNAKGPAVLPGDGRQPVCKAKAHHNGLGVDGLGKGSAGHAGEPTHEIGGRLPVEGGILWCATEKASKEALDQTIAIVKEVLAQ